MNDISDWVLSDLAEDFEKQMTPPQCKRNGGDILNYSE